MSAEENTSLIQRVYTEGFNQGNLSVVDEVFSPNFIDRSTPEQIPGTIGVKDYISAVRKGFPDISVTIDDVFATDDQVAVRTTWRGTHLGMYEGAAPTGRAVSRTMIQIFHVASGKLNEEWSEGESLHQLLK